MTYPAPNTTVLRSVVETHQPDFALYADFYRNVHRHPEISAMEENTAKKVAAHLERLGYAVHAGIGATPLSGRFRAGRESRRS